MDYSNFFYPLYPYRGQRSPEKLEFNANLQEFSQRIGYISALATNGKLPTDEAYQQIKSLMKELKQSKKCLGLKKKKRAIGSRVRVIFPDYAAGFEGEIYAKEAPGRWIIKLFNNPLLTKLLAEENASYLLSLKKSDFDVINPSTD